MKCLVTYKTFEQASEKRRLLAERGIRAKVVVDPMESIYPALCSFKDVCLLVEERDLGAARNALRDQEFRKAS